MKNSADQGRCYMLRLKVDNTLRDLQNSSYPAKAEFNFIVAYYYSFKIFPHFQLVKTRCIIHHNWLLLTQFGRNFDILNH